MNDPGQDVRALVLFTGSLDSQLAVHLLKEQGLDTTTVTYTHPLFDERGAQRVAMALGVEQVVEDITHAVLDLLNADAPGSGDIDLDLRVVMLQHAKTLCETQGFDVLATGDVLHQNKSTQNEEAFDYAARAACCEELIVRPLSAKRLPASGPENKGWVKRHALLQLEGAGREPQERLAAERGLSIPEPSRAVSWHDEQFMARVRDMREHGGLRNGRHLERLKIGRHFRLSDTTKLIVARNQEENIYVEGRSLKEDLLLKVEGARGPTAVLPFTASREEKQKAAEICARYSQSNPNGPSRVKIWNDRTTEWVESTCISEAELETCRIDRGAGR